MFKHALISTDGSPVSNKTVKAVITLASALCAEVTDSHVVEPMQLSYLEGRVSASLCMEVCHG